jgi:hypothetical protein
MCGNRRNIGKLLEIFVLVSFVYAAPVTESLPFPTLYG